MLALNCMRELSLGYSKEHEVGQFKQAHLYKQ